MRRLGYVCALLLLAASGCGDEDDDNIIDSGVTTDAPPGGADASTIDGDLTQPDAATPDSGGGGGMAPNISQVAWAPMGACSMGTASNYRITTTVNDPDTLANMLTFSGSATSCTGAINGDMVTINCPNLAGYAANVTVTDPEGNSDSQAFTINVCMSGSAP